MSSLLLLDLCGTERQNVQRRENKTKGNVLNVSKQWYRKNFVANIIKLIYNKGIGDSRRRCT